MYGCSVEGIGGAPPCGPHWPPIGGGQPHTHLGGPPNDPPMETPAECLECFLRGGGNGGSISMTVTGLYENTTAAHEGGLPPHYGPPAPISRFTTRIYGINLPMGAGSPVGGSIMNINLIATGTITNAIIVIAFSFCTRTHATSMSPPRVCSHTPSRTWTVHRLQHGTSAHA